MLKLINLNVIISTLFLTSYANAHHIANLPPPPNKLPQKGQRISIQYKQFIDYDVPIYFKQSKSLKSNNNKKFQIETINDFDNLRLMAVGKNTYKAKQIKKDTNGHLYLVKEKKNFDKKYSDKDKCNLLVEQVQLIKKEIHKAIDINILHTHFNHNIQNGNSNQTLHKNCLVFTKKLEPNEILTPMHLTIRQSFQFKS